MVTDAAQRKGSVNQRGSQAHRVRVRRRRSATIRTKAASSSSSSSPLRRRLVAAAGGCFSSVSAVTRLRLYSGTQENGMRFPRCLSPAPRCFLVTRSGSLQWTHWLPFRFTLPLVPCHPPTGSVLLICSMPPLIPTAVYLPAPSRLCSLIGF